MGLVAAAAGFAACVASAAGFVASTTGSAACATGLAAPAAGVVAEAMTALVLAEAVTEKFGGDSLTETARNLRSYLENIPEFLDSAGA